jgi:dienelactone hydrolase
MAEILLFHHAQGLTEGVVAFADELRAAGHVVHTPDLYAGRAFAALDDGLAHLQELGFDATVERGVQAADGLPSELVYIGFSLGVMPAQRLAQTRPGAQAAVLAHSAVAPEAFGSPWPAGVPLQLHIMDDDPQAVTPYDDLDTARALHRTLAEAELFEYPGDRHLFADPSLDDYDARAAALLTRRVLTLLG